MRKTPLIFIGFLLINNLIFCQEYSGIKGVVKDSATGETIPFAVVRDIESNKGVNANENGVFVLKGLMIGRRKIQISAVGYSKAIKTVNLKAGDFKSVSVFLKNNPVELSSVYSETEKSRSTSLANISVQSISDLDLKTIPLTLEKDIFRSIKSLPGVATTGDVTGKFFVRGGSSDQNSVFLDNMYIYNPFHALGLFSIFNGEIVKSADVITGGFDPEYGGKLSSVVKVLSRDGNKNKNVIKLNLGMLSGNATTEGPLGEGSYIISYRRSYFDDMLKRFLGREVPLSFDDLFAKMSFNFNNEGKFAFSSIYSSDCLNRVHENDPRYTWRNYAFGATFQSFISQFFISSSFTVADFRMNESYSSSTYGTNGSSTYSSISFNAKSDYQFDFNDVASIGFDMLSYNLNAEYVNSYNYHINPYDNMNDLGFYFKYKFAQLPNLLMDIGGRYTITQIGEERDHIFEPRMNLRIKVAPWFSLKLSYTRMHQTIISNLNEDDIIPLFETWTAIKAPLEPEKSNQYVLGFDFWLSDKINTVIQGYAKQFYHLAVYNLQRKSKDDPDFISGTGNSRGIEMICKFRFSDLNGWVTYNLGWAEKLDNDMRYAPRYDKRHSLSVIFNIPLIYGINMSTNWDFSTGMPFTPITAFFQQPEIGGVDNPDEIKRTVTHVRFGAKNSYRMPVYHKLDLHFSRKILLFDVLKSEISMDATNLYNRNNLFYYNKDTGERVNMLPFFISFSLGVEL